MAKSSRNKTIDFSPEEGRDYLDRCLILTEAAKKEEIVDRTVLGNTFSVAPLLPAGMVDLMIVDPPYNLDKDFHGARFQKRDDLAYQYYTEEWVRLLRPLLAPHASLYVCCDWRSSPAIAQVLKEYFYLQNRITWQREKGRGSATNWKNAMEDIWFVTCDKTYTFHPERVMQRRRVIAPYRSQGRPKDWEETPEGKFRNTAPSNFWDDISIPYWSMAENTAHPTQKPEKLLAKLILASSEPKDLVFDPFLGSGSTSVTAKKLGRHYLGIEQQERYCAWAEYRLQRAEEDKTIQGYTDGVFWERNTKKLQEQRKHGYITVSQKKRD